MEEANAEYNLHSWLQSEQGIEYDINSRKDH